MPYVQGYLIVNQGRPDQGLPGQQPGIDNSLPGFSGGGYIDNTLPPPPGIWPPPVEIWPPTPLPPGYPMPPGSIWPPVNVNRPDQSLPGSVGNRPDQSLPGSQPGVDNTLPGTTPPDSSFPKPMPSQKYLVAIVAASGAGVKVVGYTVVDPNLSVGFPLPGNQPGIDNSLPGSQPLPGQGLPGSQPLPGQGL